MKQLYYLLLAMGMAFLSSNAICAKKNVPLKYEINCAGSGTQGYYIVKVKATVEKKGDISEALLKRCAVHGVLFRGYGPGQGCTSQPPMTNAQTESQNNSLLPMAIARIMPRLLKAPCKLLVRVRKLIS